jgi:hypothetical protein
MRGRIPPSIPLTLTLSPQGRGDQKGLLGSVSSAAALVGRRSVAPEGQGGQWRQVAFREAGQGGKIPAESRARAPPGQGGPRSMILGVLWAGQLAAVVAGYRLSRRCDPAARALAAVAPWAAVTLLSRLAIAALGAPYSPWDVVRLAPTVGMARGFPLYSGRHDGAILSTMYGPFSAIAYLPAALAADPAVAAVAGRALACLYFFAPLYLVCLHPGGGDDTPAEVRRGGFLLAALAALASPPLCYSATQIHSDAPALGLAGLAIWLAMRPGGTTGWGPALLASALGWLSVWSKQTMIVLPLCLPLWAWAIAGAKAGLRCGVAAVATGGVIAAAFLLRFDRDAMLFNAVLWPGHLPWKGSTPGNLADALVELLPQILPFAVVLGAGPIRRAWACHGSRSWFLPVAVGVAMVPLALLGRVKKGGDLNSFSPALYPLLLACAARVVRYAANTEWRRPLVAALVGLAALGVPAFIRDAKTYARLRPARAEVDYLAAHPGAVYFPWHPLAHLVAEGRPTHHLHSVWERGVAGYPVPRDHAMGYIPGGCRFVAFPLKRLGPVVGFAWSFELLEHHDLLGPGARPVRLAGLPDYECYALRR